MKSDDYLNISEIVKTYTGMSLIYPDALKNKTTEEITKLHEDEQDFKNNIYGISDEQLESGYKLQEELIKCCGLALIDCNKADNTYYLHRKQITSFFNDSEWDCPKKFKISNHEDDNKQPEPQKGSEVDFKKEYSKGSDLEKQVELYDCLDIDIVVDIHRKKIHVSGDDKSPYNWNEIFGTKCPSIMSKCTQSIPADSAALISRFRLPKSEFRIEAAIFEVICHLLIE